MRALLFCFSILLVGGCVADPYAQTKRNPDWIHTKTPQDYGHVRKPGFAPSLKE